MTKSQELENQLAAAKKEEEKAQKEAERNAWVAFVGKTFIRPYNHNYDRAGERKSTWRNCGLMRVTHVTEFDGFGRFEVHIKRVHIVTANGKCDKKHNVTAEEGRDYSPHFPKHDHRECSPELLDQLYNQATVSANAMLEQAIESLSSTTQEYMTEVKPLPAEVEAILDIPHAKLEPHESTHVPHEPFLIGYCYLLSPASKKAAADRLYEEEMRDARCSGFDCGRYLTDQANARASVRRKLGI